MKILCRTLFDCTYTGVTGNFKINQIPFDDHSGAKITCQADWEFSRNQQRNWETIMQIISLRAQPTVLTQSKNYNDAWEFQFEIESDGVYSTDGNVDNYELLLNECNSIPMIVGLEEIQPLAPQLISQGQDQNIWFETVNN